MRRILARDKDKSKEKENEFNVNKCLAELVEYYELGKRYYGKAHKKMQILNSTDQGDLWRAIGAKFPPYQILPDSNSISYIKNNILASLYTVSKSAQLVPTCEDDVDVCTTLNVALEHEWDLKHVGYYQFLAGERASLMNYGLTQAGWDSDADEIFFKNVDPMRFMRDPFADKLQEGGWCCTYESYHKSVFINDSRYKDEFIKATKNRSGIGSTEQPPDYRERTRITESEDHYVLFIWWKKNDHGGIDEIHTLNNNHILYRTEDIQPNMFPFAELYCNLPGSSLIGVSEPAKAFANNLVYNLMDSISYTGEYKNQRPPKFINSQSGLNVAAFTKHGNEADRTFIVNGDPSKAVVYHQFPQTSPSLVQMQDRLLGNIQTMSGVDGRYTGRDTGSIITTGGTEEMLNRVTLIDTPKVMNYEDYTRQLSELTLGLLLEFGPKRTYLVKDEQLSRPGKAAFKSVEVDFPEINPEGVFEYVIQISSELPKNKQRVQAWANNMMEKQMQYQQAGMNVDIITPEEWIRFQDVPYQEQMLERMGVQAGLNAYMEAQNVISEYGTMLEQGVLPEDALNIAADGLESMRRGEPTPLQQAAPMDDMGEAPIME